MSDARRKLSAAFIKALLTSFERGGAEAVARAVPENPDELRRIMAALEPKRMKITDGLAN